MFVSRDGPLEGVRRGGRVGNKTGREKRESQPCKVPSAEDAELPISNAGTLKAQPTRT